MNKTLTIPTLIVLFLNWRFNIYNAEKKFFWRFGVEQSQIYYSRIWTNGLRINVIGIKGFWPEVFLLI